MTKRMCDLYADGNLRFIVKKRCPEDISFFYVQALMDKKIHRMKVTTISEVYHAVISTAFKCRGRK